MLDAVAILIDGKLCVYVGVSIHMGQGGHIPPIFGLGGHYHECPPQYF